MKIIQFMLHSVFGMRVLMILGLVAGSVLAVAGADAPTGGIKPVDVRTHGALGDGNADDTQAIQAAIDTVRQAGGGVVYVPKGTYVVNGLTLYSNIQLVGSGWESVLKTKTGPKESDRPRFLVSVNRGDGGTPNPADNAVNIVIRDLQLRGTVDTDGFFEQKHLLNLNAVSHVLIENVNFTGFRGDAVYLGSGNLSGIERHNIDVTIRKCLFDGLNNENRNGVSIIDGDGIIVEDSVFHNVTKKGMPGQIDVEPDEGSYPVVRNLRFRHNAFDHCGGGFGIVYYTPHLKLDQKPSNIVIANNQFLDDCIPTGYMIAVITGEEMNETLPAMNVLIESNVIKSQVQPIHLKKVKGAVVKDNYFPTLWVDQLVKDSSGVKFENNGHL